MAESSSPAEQPSAAGPSACSAVSVVRYSSGGFHAQPDVLAVEEPLEIRLVHGPRNARVERSISVTMRTPGHDAELAAGFLLTEGVIRDEDDIIAIHAAPEATPDQPATSANPEQDRPRTGSIVRVELAPGVEVNASTLERNFYTTSSCGICGKASLLALRSVSPPRRPNYLTVSASMLCELPARLRAAQPTFQRTGGLHGAALFSAAGELQSVREDVGRHNAVDKLLGAAFLAGHAPLREHLLLLSGRASFELLQKAVMAGVPLVAAVGAPSSLAVQVAADFDITLVGFLRDGQFNIYHGAERVAPAHDA